MIYVRALVIRQVSQLNLGRLPDGIFVFHFQFLMDYNLYGMNLLHASAAKFRNPVRLVDGDGMKIKNFGPTT